MSGSTVPPSGGSNRQPWTPEQGPRGVTCPACGLANETGARTCRNCGLPIASDDDPLRGVAPGRIDLPKARRSGLSATIGFVMVIALLLIGGSLALSGGGILSSGGRLGAAEPSPSGEPVSDGNGSEVVGPVASVDPETGEAVATPEPSGLTTSFDYTCEDDAIRDVSRGKWFMSDVQAGLRADSDQIYWNMSRTAKTKAKKGTIVTMEWMTPKAAQKKYGLTKVLGDRALLITFDGPVDITANQTILGDQLEGEGIEQIKKIQLFEGKDGKVRTAIGLDSDSCARMGSKNWGKNNKRNNGLITLDIERFDP